eukprot:m.431140 g.431140  ORF g.431140 m.431140 type:complete len:241 (+) comp17262_c0_seq1:50-772(+)
MSRGDRWLGEYERACSKADEAQAAINERDRLTRSGQNAAKVTSQIRRLLNELQLSVRGLEDAVNQAGNEYHITDAEFSRRQNLVATLKGRWDELQSGYGRDGRAGGNSGATGFERNQLFGVQESGDDRQRYREEGDATRGLDNHGMLERQQQIMRDQDQGLDILQASIARQKNMGLAIGNELDDQNDMLDELGDAMDNTDARLTRETQHVIKVTENAKSGGMCCCIVLLVIAIIAVAAVG